jgi:hypothetical protein
MISKNKIYLKLLFGSIEQYGSAARNGWAPGELKRYKAFLLDELKKIPEIVEKKLDQFFSQKCDLIEAEFVRNSKN